MDGEKKLLLDSVDEAFDGGSWHGPSLRGALRGLDVRSATFRPGAERHDIWELIVHIAYWKFIVRRRLSGDVKARFVYRGRGFFNEPDVTTPVALRKDVSLLAREHRMLHRSVETMDVTPRTIRLVRGVAA